MQLFVVETAVLDLWQRENLMLLALPCHILKTKSTVHPYPTHHHHMMMVMDDCLMVFGNVVNVRIAM
jgi:hypothetical protein